MTKAERWLAHACQFVVMVFGFWLFAGGLMVLTSDRTWGFFLGLPMLCGSGACALIVGMWLHHVASFWIHDFVAREMDYERRRPPNAQP